MVSADVQALKVLYSRASWAVTTTWLCTGSIPAKGAFTQEREVIDHVRRIAGRHTGRHRCGGRTWRSATSRGLPILDVTAYYKPNLRIQAPSRFIARIPRNSFNLGRSNRRGPELLKRWAMSTSIASGAPDPFDLPRNSHLCKLLRNGGSNMNLVSRL
jgi:hypothetical protein